MNQALIIWKLREVMARYKIKSKELAAELGVHPNSVTNLRKAETMPRLDGEALDNLCNALNKLADTEISLMELVTHVPNSRN
ncbi:hypothetical protein A4S05_21110 [Nostoc sp. KVJ20]|uniref:helix-turn-helix domain-containing protein n=1 Tax=Nostoc sp. KVJ20 TaxID=457944 RepID=UPI00083CAC82|nr:helix-turn-helix transcriptional regulator [Nostoc sp. KVJ20]ODH03095.1 hypothetical protein A4S05_21110 [Nostoc sp. KVJ20]